MMHRQRGGQSWLWRVSSVTPATPRRRDSQRASLAAFWKYGKEKTFFWAGSVPRAGWTVQLLEGGFACLVIRRQGQTAPFVNSA
jgi:hypothetical protein